MAAEVCLLLMHSLTGECKADLPNMDGPLPQVEERVGNDDAVVENTTMEAIAPTATDAEPQFGSPCEGEDGQRLIGCALANRAQASESISDARPMPTVMPTVAEESPSPKAATPTMLPAVATPAVDVTTPVALEIPRSQRPVPIPTPQSPQFSAPRTVAAIPALPTSQWVSRRPTSGAQLYRQRQLALNAGQSYMRLSPETYADQWSRATRQPTYQDWKNLLAQEARAIARGQGQNRLEVVLGDSFGLWLPPEMLPRDRLWLNQSISGDTTAGILQRLGVFNNTRPTTIHLMAGANDLKNGVPEDQIVRNLQQTVRSLKQQHPQAEIVVYSVLPTRRAEIANERVRSLNARIALLTRQSAVEYRDVHQWFQDEWGHLRRDLTTDGLHLNPQGYALWQQAILARAW